MSRQSVEERAAALFLRMSSGAAAEPLVSDGAVQHPPAWRDGLETYVLSTPSSKRPRGDLKPLAELADNVSDKLAAHAMGPAKAARRVKHVLASPQAMEALWALPPAVAADGELMAAPFCVPFDARRAGLVLSSEDAQKIAGEWAKYVKTMKETIGGREQLKEWARALDEDDAQREKAKARDAMAAKRHAALVERRAEEAARLRAREAEAAAWKAEWVANGRWIRVEKHAWRVPNPAHAHEWEVSECGGF